MRSKFLTMITILCMFLPATNLSAQGEATMLFLAIEPAPSFNGMGRIGAALPNADEAFGFYYNPAQLGWFSQHTNASLQFYPGKTDWLPSYNIADLTFQSTAIAGGYDLSSVLPGLPLSVGLGFLSSEINYGENVFTNSQGEFLGTFNSHESYSALGLGFGLDYLVNVNVGFTTKQINSVLGVDPNGDKRKADASATDFGVLLHLPMLDVWPTLQSSEKSYSPFLDVSVGYSRLNSGGFVNYSGLLQSDPLPKTAVLGYAISGGINYNVQETVINFIEFDWSVDAKDILVVTDNGDREYQSGIKGDISFISHVISGSSDDKVSVHKGFRLGLFDVVSYASGEFEGRGWDKSQTDALTFKAAGILKWLATSTNAPLLAKLGKSIDLQFSRSEVNTVGDNPLDGTTYRSLNLVYRYVK